MTTLEVREKATGHRLWSTAEYYKMVDAGILGPHDRVELIDGEVINLAPIGPEHSLITNKIFRGLLSLIDALGQEFSVFHETPITMIDGTEPQPDVIVARGPMDSYWDHHPRPADLCLVVEVSATTLLSDRKRKLPMYASFGIQEVWIVNINERQVEVFRDPTDTRYSTTQVYTRGDVVELSFAPGKTIPVADVLPSTE